MNQASQTFGQAAADYAAARPTYPAALFDWIAEAAPCRDRVWDVGTGTGQAAVDLAARFKAVHATDFSAGQIAAAKVAPNITYVMAPAESSRLPDHWADAVTAANALHWFDFDKFWPEVRRVSRPGALFAAWGYNWFFVSNAFDADVTTRFRNLIAPFWAPNNRLNWDGYRDADIRFPFTRVSHPAFTIELAWSFSQIMAFMQTWSAYRLSRNDAAVSKAMDELLAGFAKTYRADEIFQVRMPLVMVAGKI